VLYDSPPRQLFIDLDVTDDPVQAGIGVFNRYYDSVCYVHLLWWDIIGQTPSNVDPAAGALDELKRIIPSGSWPQVQLVVRGDAPIPVTTL